jgi:hypothetical protein
LNRLVPMSRHLTRTRVGCLANADFITFFFLNHFVAVSNNDVGTEMIDFLYVPGVVMAVSEGASVRAIRYEIDERQGGLEAGLEAAIVATASPRCELR